MKTSKPLAIALAAAAALALFTGAVAAPILCRPFYYAHIGPLELEARTGLTREEIKTAFDEMLDYCLGGEGFSTGVLRWSDSGRDHFTDVRGLFLLDLWAFAAALAVLGYSQGEINLALKGIDLDGLALEQIIKQALKKMVKG